MTVTLDQFQFFNGNPYRPFGFALPLVGFDYLHERQHKRELRLESAQKGTAIAESQQQDLERTLLFSLRSAFVQTLQAKALLANAKENLDYYDKELDDQPRAAFRPATSRAWTWTAWCCSGCNTNRITRRRW